MVRFRLWDNGDGVESWGWLLDDVEIREQGPLTVGVSVSINPSGGGTVAGNGINCPGDCAEVYQYNWALSGRDWTLISTDYESPTHSVSASPNGNYADNANSIIELATPIDISGATNPALSFWHKYSTASSFFYGWDYCYVEISQDYGITWTQIGSFNGAIASWTKEELSLAAYKAKPILVRFRLWDNGDGVESWGWLVDDVQIKDLATAETYFADNFESSHSVPSFNNVTVTATPSTNYVFSSWTGCNSTSGTSCTVNSYIDKSITANFITAFYLYPSTLAFGNEGVGVTSAPRAVYLYNR